MEYKKYRGYMERQFLIYGLLGFGLMLGLQEIFSFFFSNYSKLSSAILFIIFLLTATTIIYSRYKRWSSEEKLYQFHQQVLKSIRWFDLLDDEEKVKLFNERSKQNG